MSEAIPDIFGYLNADSALKAIVQSRIFPMVLMEETPLPALTYQIIDSTTNHTLDGPSDGLRRMRLQVDCWAASYGDLDKLTWQVRRLFDGFQGFMGAVWVNNTQHENLIDEFEPARRQYRRILDFYIFYNDVES